MAHLSEKDVNIILQNQRGSLSSEVFETEYRPLSEFELKVAENCISNTDWKIEKK